MMEEYHISAFFLDANSWKCLRVPSLHCRFLPPLHIIYIFAAFLPCLCLGLEFQGSLGTALTSPHRFPSSPAYICHYVSHLLLFPRTLCCLNKQTNARLYFRIPKVTVSPRKKSPTGSLQCMCPQVCAARSRARGREGEAGVRNMNPGARRAAGEPTHISMCG